MVTSLWLGLLALGVGPLLAPLLRRQLALASAVDGFVLVSVCGLVILQVVPQSVDIVGASAIAWLVVGMVVPVVLHRFDQRAPPGAARVKAASAVVVVGVGLFVHALLDGSALVTIAAGHHDEHHHDDGVGALALAVILHRVPTSVAVWVMGRDRFGTAGAVGLLLALAAGTVVGASNVSAVVGEGSLGVGGLAAMQAFAAGAVLHVLIDAPALDVSPYRRASAIGAGLAVAALVALTHTHPVLRLAEDELHFSQTLLTLVAEAAPGVVVAVVVVGLVRRLQRAVIIGQGHSALARVFSGIWGALSVPHCACGACPVVDDTLRRRGAIGAVAAFLVASPAFYIPALALSMALFGGAFAALGVVGALVMAVVVGVIAEVGHSSADVGGVASIDGDGGKGVMAVVDHVGPWLFAGMALAAICEPLMAPDLLHIDNDAVELPVAVLLGVPLYACGVAAIPLVAVLVHKGLSLGAAAAFLAAAPVLNVAVFSRLRRRESPAAIVAAVAAASCAAALGVVVNAAVAAGVIASPSLHQDAGHDHGVVELAAVVVCATALVAALWRQGARGFLGQIIRPLDEALGGHIHGPHCGHRTHAGPSFVKRAPVARITIDAPLPKSGPPGVPGN